MSEDKKYYQLERHQLKERIKYNFCPYCWKQLKGEGVLEDKILKDPETLGTLWYKKVLIHEHTEQGGDIAYTEETYFCTKCKRTMTVDDFEKAYCKPYEIKENR